MEDLFTKKIPKKDQNRPKMYQKMDPNWTKKLPKMYKVDQLFTKKEKW